MYYKRRRNGNIIYKHIKLNREHKNKYKKDKRAISKYTSIKSKG